MSEAPVDVGEPLAPLGVLSAQVEALIERIEINRDRQRAASRAAAEQQVRELLRSARKEALADVRAAIARERKQSEQALQQAVATAALEMRQRAQAATRTLLTVMWAAIDAALDARWADAAHRKSWIEVAIREARGVLSEPNWRIEHGEGWSPAELDELAALAAGDVRDPKRTVELASDPTVRAGIRIRTARACFDATAAGLLASRARIESDFLAQFLSLDKPQ